MPVDLLVVKNGGCADSAVAPSIGRKWEEVPSASSDLKLAARTFSHEHHYNRCSILTRLVLSVMPWVGSPLMLLVSCWVVLYSPEHLTRGPLDDVPVLRRRYPITNPPNPWSHPLPIFTYEDFQIHVQFLSDPAIIVCSAELYPNDSWKSGNHVLATRSKKDFHMHPISDFSPWIARHMTSGISWDAKANHHKAWRVWVEDRSEDSDRILWEIIRASWDMVSLFKLLILFPYFSIRSYSTVYTRTYTKLRSVSSCTYVRTAWKLDSLCSSSRSIQEVSDNILPNLLIYFNGLRPPAWSLQVASVIYMLLH